MAPVTFGLPDEWRDFERRHARLLKDFLPPLMEAATKVVARTMEREHPHERLVFMLGRHVPEDFNEIFFLLAANGYGIGALKLLRPMYERVVTMMYLIRNPEKAQGFFDWVLVEKQRTLNHLKDEGDDPTNYLTAEEVEQVKAEYERVKHYCLLLSLDEHIRHFGLAVDLAPRLNEYMKYWDRAAPENPPSGVDQGEPSAS